MRRPLLVAGIALVVIVAAGGAYFGLRHGTEASAPAAAPAADSSSAAPAAASSEMASTAAGVGTASSQTPSAPAPAPASATAAAMSGAAPAATASTVVAGSTQTADNTASAAPQPAAYPDDQVLGSDTAPITMIEYASLTCPHCAHFHKDILPQIKANYIDKGLVRLVYRDFPLDGAALRAAVLAHCVPRDRYFAMIEVLFRSQDDWAHAADPLKPLSQIARTAGMDQQTIDACMADEAAKNKIVERAQEASKIFNIESTPSFIINGQKRSGAEPYEEFDKTLKALLPKS